MEPHEAQAALAGVQSVDRQLAERLGQCPPWRHAALGMTFLLLIVTIGISARVQMLGSAGVIFLAVMLMRSDRKRYGVFINGYRRGRTLPLTLGFVGVMIGLVVAAMHMRNHGFSDLSRIGLGAIAFAIATGFSVAWHRVLRAELTKGR